jgi:uncharacterized membrane protein YozB (DUF420 family)
MMEAVDALGGRAVPVSAAVFNRPFYFFMSILIAGLVIYGFSLTIGNNLFHPSVPRPRILYLHAATFFAWVVLFVTQTAFIQSRHVRWHRRLGVTGLGLGAIMPLIGIATSLAMAKFNTLHGGRGPERPAAFLAIPFNDMIAFSIAFALAIRWRRKPEFHRRLMLVASCTLTAAAFARFPFITITEIRWYGGVDLLILLGVLHDIVVVKKIHAVYVYGVPLIVFGQVVAMTLFLQRPPAWMTLTHWLLG